MQFIRPSRLRAIERGVREVQHALAHPPMLVESGEVQTPIVMPLPRASEPEDFATTQHEREVAAGKVAPQQDTVIRAPHV